MSIFAVTSLSPAPGNEQRQQAALQSWRRAGLEVRSFNHPSEIATLAAYDVTFIPTERTTQATFGRPYVAINAMLDWAASEAVPVVLLNSDIELALTAAQLCRLRMLGDAGLVYFVRFNHDGDPARATPEPWGIDAFLFDGRNNHVVELAGRGQESLAGNARPNA